MNKFIVFFIALGIASVNSLGNVRFVNAIGQSVQIQTNLFPTISLDYTGVSEYQESSGGSVQITNIVDSTGASLIGNQPQMISFDNFYATVALVTSGSGLVCVLYNETLTEQQFFNGSQTSALVRFIDLAQLNFTNLQGSGNPNAAILFSYEGYLVNTAFTEVDTRFTSLVVAQAGTANQWSVPVSLSVSSLYTVFFFGNSGNFVGLATYDRTIANGFSTTGAVATTSEPAATTGEPSATTGAMTPSTTAAPIINTQTSSASQIFIGMTVAAAAVVLAF